LRICVLARSFDFDASHRTLNPMICPVGDKLPNGYQGLLVVVVVVAVMANDYHMVVVAAVVPIWLCKSAGCKEHKQNKYQMLLHVRTVTNAHNDCLCYIALISICLYT
jgi:hypothetical protein